VLHALAVQNFSVQFVEELNIMDFTTMPKPVTISGIGDNPHHGVVANSRKRLAFFAGFEADGICL